MRLQEWCLIWLEAADPLALRATQTPQACLL